MKTFSHIVATVNLLALVTVAGDADILATTCYAFTTTVWFLMARS